MIDLFLFEMIKKNSKVIIYGLGDMGSSYIDQIETSNWCEIVAVSDQKEIETSYKYIRPEELKTQKDYDYLVIAIESLTIANQVYQTMLSLGVPGSKIVNLNMRYGEFPSSNKVTYQNEKLQITIIEGGGFGDALMDMVFINRLKELLEDKCEILFCCRTSEYFKKFSAIDEVIQHPDSEQEMKEIRERSEDLTFIMHSMALVHKFNKEKVRAVSEVVYRYCEDCIHMQKVLFDNAINNFRITKYGVVLGKNRIEHPDLHGILGVSRYSKLDIPAEKSDTYSRTIANLLNKKYITINRDTGSDSGVHPKLWPMAYYQELLKMIKAAYPEIAIVFVGKAQKELVPFLDLNLAGKTSLQEVEVLLRNALLHIGGEGGMVHLMHFLGGRSMVFFGPTDYRVFGYP